MNFLGLNWIDWSVLAAYFALVIYIGVFLGSQKTKTLGDFFVAGGRWGALVSFFFVFASALAGNEAVVVSGRAYHSGLSGVWSGLFLGKRPMHRPRPAHLARHAVAVCVDVMTWHCC